MRTISWVTAAALLALACGDDGAVAPAGTSTATNTAGGTTAGAGSTAADTTEADSTGDVVPTIPPLPPLKDAVLTTEELIVPTHEIVSDHGLDPRIPGDLQELLDQAYGEVEPGRGAPVFDMTLDGTPAPTPGASPTLLTRFVHLADTQLLDDESPTRGTSLDLAIFPYPFRAQEAYACRILNAAVRTINALNARFPLDYVVLGGDNIDSAQTNELEWFLGIMDGAPSVHCDSGDDDDPVAGPDNDPKDPFGPVALDVPWRWVSGNHDILFQGINRLSPVYRDIATGSTADGGTRDWSQPGGPTVMGEVVPDPERALLDFGELMTRVQASGDGHGIDQAVIDFGRAHYTFDAGEVVVVVVESATVDGSTDGVIVQRDVDDFLRPALDSAQAEGRPVIIVTHHPSNLMTRGSGFGGLVHEDALEQEGWESLLGEYDNILMHLAGHVHNHRVDVIFPPGGNPYFEVLTGALADYPHQMRMIEVHDADNGFYSVTGIPIDFATDGDPLAAQGRARGITDFTSGWLADGSGMEDDRGVVLWVPK